MIHHVQMLYQLGDNLLEVKSAKQRKTVFGTNAVASTNRLPTVLRKKTIMHKPIKILVISINIVIRTFSRQ